MVNHLSYVNSHPWLNLFFLIFKEFAIGMFKFQYYRFLSSWLHLFDSMFISQIYLIQSLC